MARFHSRLAALGFSALLSMSLLAPSAPVVAQDDDPPPPPPPSRPERPPLPPVGQPEQPVRPAPQPEREPAQPQATESTPPQQLANGGLIIASGTGWKGINNPPAGWVQPSFDDSAWPAALVGFRQVVSEDRRFAPAAFLGRETAARWIWAASQADCGLRCHFELERMPARAELWIACDDTATVWCNGDAIGGWSTAGNWGRLEGGASLIDLRPYLRTGRNVIAVLAHDDWIKRGMLAEVRIDAPAVVPLAAPAKPATAEGQAAVAGIITRFVLAEDGPERDAADAAVMALGRGALWAIAAEREASDDDARSRRLWELYGRILVADGLAADPTALPRLHEAIAATDKTRWRRMAWWVLRDLASWPREALLAEFESMFDTDDAGRQSDLITLAGHLGLHEFAQHTTDLLTATESEDVARACIGALAYIGDKRHAKALEDAANRFDHPMICDYGLRTSRELAAREPK